MSSSISMKILRRGLLLISAAILISANTVLAANHVGDAQMQATDLLSGNDGESKTVDIALGSSADHQQRSYPDPQEQARQVILGKPSFNGAASRQLASQSNTNVFGPVSAGRKSRVYTDPQESARQMILGTEGSGSSSSRVADRRALTIGTPR